MSSAARERSSAISRSTAAKLLAHALGLETGLVDDLAGLVAGFGELEPVLVERRLGFHACLLRLLEVLPDALLTSLERGLDRGPRLPGEESEHDDERDRGPEDLVALGQDGVLRLDALGGEQQRCEHGRSP